jgi:phosphoglycerate dehydrogenase-like enzyme
MAVACLPFADWGDAATVPAAVDVVVYDGSQSPPDVSEVEFYVPQYMSGEHTLAVMSQMPKLQVVQTLTAGVDNVWPHLPDGVTLCNARGVHDASTAELVVGLTIAALRRIPDFVRAQESGEWLAGRFDALADKRVLIVGCGSVGRAVERRFAGFEVEITRVARHPREGVEPFERVAELLPLADVVVLVCPLTAQTRGLVDAEFLARMPDGALLVNAARGPVVVTDDLLAEVRTGRLRAALDVTDPEPLPRGHELWRAPGVLITPHVGGNTTAFLPRAYRLVSAQLARWAAGEPLENVAARPSTLGA